MAKTGLIAGKGDLPFLMRDALLSQSHELFILAIKDATNPALVEGLPHQWIDMAEIARTLEIFSEQSIKNIVMAGGMKRPPMKALKPPALAARILKRMGTAFLRGDDALFKAIVSIFEEEGFSIIGADEVLQELLTPKGTLTTTKPENEQDIQQAINAAKALGTRDVGQAVIALNGEIIGEEDSAGTDALLKRVGSAQGAILAKAKKPNQERRVDLPTIGPDTITRLSEYGYTGIVLEANHSLILHRETVIKHANEHGLFVVGL